MTSWDANEPYNTLPPPPPATDLETPAVLKAAIGANASLARLDQAAASMPNPTVLINTIPLLEAQASSEIENIVTTTDALFQHAEHDAGADPATRETLRYRTALRIGSELTEQRGVTTNTATAICSAIKGVDMRVRTLPGTRIGNQQSGKIVYSPPEGQSVLNEKLSEWERFIHTEDDLDPLIRMAAAHYQFEAIHPFSDGNGRTGRILNVLLLVEAGLLQYPLLYLSRYIIDTKDEYYARLVGVTAEGAWEAWLTYLLTGIDQTSRATVAKIGAIVELQNVFMHDARAALGGPVDVEFLAVLFEQPYARIGTVVERCSVSRPTATKWLNALVDADMLVSAKIGRERLFINYRFLRLLRG
ncbi:Fic family protein [Demequina aurantiaca]|uniref:Fic family protein n=1 Tax=Demequina aurantiaca TaxID=676200 RepID=UPI0007810B53|nr:Fic/DOC family N-terminal domain-containing protein [Demequina aurantiaca]